MATQVWCFGWHANIVPHTLVDVLIAARADVHLLVLRTVAHDEPQHRHTTHPKLI